ncbi:MAG: sensor histidine kinase [Ignavibacteriales bacterium]|nr:MAG: sensor histidine kinase [Ignavibacteriales bacterium]
MNVKFYNRLSIQLILVISVVLVVNYAFHAFYTVSKLENDLNYSWSQNAYNMSDIIKKSTRYGMLLNRRDDVHQIIKTIGTEVGVEKIRIYNKMGQIIFSTDTTEINTTVNMQEEACVACHMNDKIISSPPMKNRIRIFKDASNKKVIGLINPIFNEKDCYTSECHAHSPKAKLLGVLDVVLSGERIEEMIQSNTSRFLSNSVLITLIISVVIWLFISFLVNRPIKKFAVGLKEIGKGNLDYKIDISSRNELGEMATQFNDMSVKLDSAYKEIQQWTKTLNDKVNEKTEELKKIYNQIIQIEKLASLGKLSATVAHELNNPLEGILTYCKLIAKKLTKQQKENEFEQIINYLNLISDESARCGRIVKDLLLFSHRGNEDEFMLEDINTIIDKCTMIIKHHLEMNKINLVKEIKTDKLKLKSDSQKLQQALISMLINAIEAMPNGGNIIIRITDEADSLVIRIIDEGSGIAEKDLPHIFEPFYTTKQDAKGTGLGLAVAYGIIEHHKGKIEIENTSLKGTTFKVTLPLLTENNKSIK